MIVDFFDWVDAFLEQSAQKRSLLTNRFLKRNARKEALNDSLKIAQFSQVIAEDLFPIRILKPKSSFVSKLVRHIEAVKEHLHKDTGFASQVFFPTKTIHRNQI